MRLTFDEQTLGSVTVLFMQLQFPPEHPFNHPIKKIISITGEFSELVS